jgi:hypothetical protein
VRELAAGTTEQVADALRDLTLAPQVVS